jgi:cobalt-zinc-cadmium efflux system outer membrane protein
MRTNRLLAVSIILFFAGCAHGPDARVEVDETVCCITGHPYDLPPPPLAASPVNPSATPTAAPPTAAPQTVPATNSQGLPTSVPADTNSGSRLPSTNGLRTVSWLAADAAAEPQPAARARFDLHIPAEIPGSETRRIELSDDPATKRRQIQRLYPPLPPLPTEPLALTGPNNRCYTLADLQQIAAANSPTLRQAASDVEAARGNLMQAAAYPNPTVSYTAQPSSDESTSGVQGVLIDQTIKTGGKLKLATAAAEVDLRNSELALRRARSDLSTQVRNAYFALLVAKETMRVNKALAHFTDEVYRLQADSLMGTFAAAYEPAALRAQAYTIRFAYQQSIQTYIYAWKQLVAAINVRQLPLSEVAGRIDANIPFYDYDAVLLYVLRNHTDMLTARNGVDKARYNLKLAQITPVPDVDVQIGLEKDFVALPKLFQHTVQIGVPLPIWDQNRGGILSAESALIRAQEEPHRVEENLTTTLATNYVNYKNNLQGLEFYRRYILPDQVRTYRGTYERRQIDQNASFGDLVSAQQTLTANVATYLTILGQLWSSVVSVADLMETDDLFQLGSPLPVPTVSDLECLMPLPCCHPCAEPFGASPMGAAPNDSGLVPSPLAPAAPAEPIERPRPAGPQPTGPASSGAPPAGLPPADPQSSLRALPEPRLWQVPATDGAVMPSSYPPLPWATQQPPNPSPAVWAAADPASPCPAASGAPAVR